jgi:hypothetical protein
MPSRAQRLQTVQLIAARESALADLYQEYAFKLPEHTPVFRKLASDEEGRAAAVARFFAATRGAAHCVSPGPIRLQAVRTSLGYIRGCLVESRSEQPTRLSALSIAHDLEQSAIKRRFFEAGESESERRRTLLARLAGETIAHRCRGAAR